MNNWCDPKQVFAEYEQGVSYKAGLGARGLYEQNRVNERFMVGDQWHGARCGNDRPLVRHNVIKRIGDYKMAVVGAGPVTVNYSAEGVPNTLELKHRVGELREQFLRGELPSVSGDEELALVMSALTDYFRVTAERVGFDSLREAALRDAYVTGTGLLYTYWDESVQTGLYADSARRVPICGDLQCEVLDVENVYFGDPSCDDIQKQPYIILAQRRRVEDIQRLMKRHHRPAADIETVRADNENGYQSGDYGTVEQDGNRRALLLTKLCRHHGDDGRTHIRAVQVCRGVTVRRDWDLGVRLYPLAKFTWERRKNCAYGESEVTYLIPNQIAINRMLTASVWAVMMMGMPMLVVNGDLVQQPISNEPGQVVQVYGGATDVQNAMRYVDPPAFAPAFDNNIASLIQNTLTQSGANDSALGDVDPHNTSAIIAVREAAMMPMQTVQNRFYAFLEDVARIWAEFWVSMYGERSLKVETAEGVWYLPFDGRRYRELLISARVEVGASTLWSESESIRTLDNLFERQVITPVQYLKRLPRGTVPEVNGLIRDLEQAAPPPDEGTVLDGLDEHSRAVYDALPEERRAALLREALGGGV
ncbi:MAG: hypothetical protein IKB04_09215 [Clostridia bacterium]|nr:hypothetical protein [Clostridia bacterium]MBR2407197.1 hypothetical protein [Clostridia bacterium]